jgi:hypothetical protein
LHASPSAPRYLIRWDRLRATRAIRHAIAWLMALFCYAVQPAWGGASWYLLFPPIGEDGSRVMFSRPLATWSHEQTFENEADCERKLQDARAEVLGMVESIHDPAVRTLAEQTIRGRCVASDDLRLGS